MNLGLTWSLHSAELLFLWFLTYSIIGWISESTICSISAGHFINRGFLFGPYCPIYGVGALVGISILSAETNPIVIFFSGLVLCCSIEYFTSWALEKLFHARWWDYSNRFMNIHGRICLRSALYFGVLSVVGVVWVQPELERLTAMIPAGILNIVAGILFALFMLDLILTLRAMGEFKKLIDELQPLLDAEQKRAHELAGAVVAQSQANVAAVQQALAQAKGKLKATHERHLLAFAQLRSTDHESVIEALRAFVRTGASS